MTGTTAQSELDGASDDVKNMARADGQIKEHSGARAVASRAVAPVIVLIVAALAYSAIYFREESIPTAIGANLVPAERLLEGEIPYRDFYKIQTPGILLLNAALFKYFGATLIAAYAGVMVFKALAVLMVFLTARLVSPMRVAIIPTLLAFVWLQPGGPFRPAPIQYETLFILAAIYFTLRWIDSRRWIHVFAAGLMVGLVAVFKQNVGVYSAVALGLTIILRTNALPRSFREAKQIYLDSWKTAASAHIAAAIGVSIPLVALLIYLLTNDALGPAIRVFLQGPGEHIEMRLTGYPLPKHAAVVFIAIAAALMLASRFGQRRPRLRLLIVGVTLASAMASAILIPVTAIDNSIYWFAPALFIYALWRYARASRDQTCEYSGGRRERGALLVLLVFSMASFGEVFPRSVRGLIIGTLPPALILFAFLLRDRPALKEKNETLAVKTRTAFSRSRALAFAVVSLVLFVFALRLVLPRYFYFDSTRLMRFRAETELGFDRGRGILMPAGRAEEATATVDLIRSRVEENGYFFAHSLDATSYYFLADRNSPTGATLWNDAGTNDRERARTMKALREHDVRLVLTNEQALKIERYEPLLDYLKNDFHQTAVIGRTIFLERNY